MAIESEYNSLLSTQNVMKGISIIILTTLKPNLVDSIYDLEIKIVIK